MLLGLIIIFTSLTPLHLLDSAAAGILSLVPQIMPNPAPKVIPSLHEWQGSTGSFTLSSASRIAVDPSYTAQLENTAKVFQNDLFAVTRHTLPVVTAISPAAGDFFLTLHTPDPGIGSEGYLFQVDATVVIAAHTSTGIFYGTRNDFHLHLNDNEIGGGDSLDWMHKYAAFRLNSPRFPGLAARDGSYSRQDMRALQDIASAYAVTITPEIDAPAHDLAFTQYRPDLASQNASKEFLDLNNPATYTFLNAIWDEFLPWFDSKQVDIGADEYPPNDADKYREFVNIYNDYLRSKGKTIRMWGSLTKMQSNVRVNTNIVIDDWNNAWANPMDMLQQGYPIINANDNLLYIVPKAGYYHDYLDTQMLYDHWEPYVFSLSDPGLNVRPGDSHLLGGMFSEWNDKLGSVISDADVHARVKPAMQTLSQKLWSGTAAGMPYNQFLQLAQIIGEAPDTHLPQT